MTFNDTFAYIPLFAAAAAALIILILLVVIYKKNTARVSFTAFLADAFVIAGTVMAASLPVPEDTTSKSLIIVACALFAASFVLIPYCIVLCTLSSKKRERLSASSFKANSGASNADNAVPQQKIAELSQQEINMLDINRSFTVHAADAFSSEKGMNDLLDFINTTIISTVHADGGAVLLVDDFDDVIAVKSFSGDFPPPYKLPSDMPHKPVRVATNFKFASFPLHDNIFGEVATSGKPELITKPEADDRIYQNGPEEFLECGSYLIIPMKLQDTVIGVMALSRKHGNALFTEEDLKTTTTLSEFAAAAIKSVISVKDVVEHSEITKEADIACRIQETLHPAKLPALPGVFTGVYWNPAEGVCGDYYDIIPSRKDRISFVVADIAGKGTNSMVIMIMLRSLLRLVVNTKQTAGTILSWANRGIANESFSTDHFASCALINYDSVTNKVEFATGGTTPVLYYNAATDTISRISQTSEPIGVEKTTEYKDFSQEVKSGDILVAYTDGLVESLNEKGQQYGHNAVQSLIKSNHASSSKDIANLVKADIKNFSGSATQHDDQTLLVIKIK